MRRRQLLELARSGALFGLGLAGTTWARQAVAQGAQQLRIQYLGHMCFLFSGAGKRVLVNPFRALGCTQRYRVPAVSADLVLISSRLLDEGAIDVLPGNPQILFEPGAYNVQGLTVQGIRSPHDLREGRRFGDNVAWRWAQAGITILHLGGAAAPLTLEQRILTGSPDILFVPVGGGAKSYNAQQAAEAVKALNPKIVVPTQYRAPNLAEGSCDLSSVDEFLSLMQGSTIRRGNGDSLTLTPGRLPDKGPVVQTFAYRF
ncbi:MBL fold metallo-hydrolase [Leptolyngbya sp. FACHB-261]|uniref:MBL fold metallo-hydrolase n=1 Tax=Leptolyngbya sp. FACHB-261 TaxID=2692806 RepID=UPI001681D9C7|nr:MBL fold metallo-hydrolase [Leptolyngbya sp. FACHB-261]MBD2103722.1 MBL fold metallo-hydrolase [Leptolyngbya sp. FACHB-261]